MEHELRAKHLVLLVEDDEDLRELLGFHLRDLGLEVMEAGDVAGAQKVINELEVIDLVIADYTLPERQTGLSLAEWTRAHQDPNKAKIKFIIMTGDHSQFDSVKASDLGILEFLPKPFDSEHFVNTLNTVLESNY